MKKFILVFCILLVSTLVFAKKITEDTLILGKPNSATDIEIKDPTGNNILKVNKTTDTWQFSNDAGANFLDIGAGGGGGSGALNVLENPNAEAGLQAISNTGGTLTEVTTPAADILEGSKSFRFDPASQNDVVAFDAVTISKGLYGRSCEARVQYIGGDTESRIEVVDANSDVLGSLDMPEHSIYGPESVFFLCPSEADVTGDANKGILTLQIRQTTTTNGAAFTFDENHLGGLIGLAELTTPDVLTVDIENNGSITIGDSNGGTWWDSITRTGTGVVVVNYASLGLSSIPAIVGQIKNQQIRIISADSVTTTSATFSTRTVSNVSEDRDFNIILVKQGADAKQAVQVYKSIPKVSENVNEYTAYINSSGVVLNENVDWITGNCTSASGVFNCDVTSLNLTQKLFCQVGGDSTVDVTGTWDEAGTTLTNIRYRTFNGGSVSSAFNVLRCYKTEADFKLPTVQPVIVGQVSNSFAESASKNVRVESCLVENSGGTPTTNSYMCNNWIDSLNDTGTGATTLNFSSGTFGQAPVCVASIGENNTAGETRVFNFSTSSVQVQTTSSPSVAADQDFVIICQGEK